MARTANSAAGPIRTRHRAGIRRPQHVNDVTNDRNPEIVALHGVGDKAGGEVGLSGTEAVDNRLQMKSCMIALPQGFQAGSAAWVTRQYAQPADHSNRGSLPGPAKRRPQARRQSQGLEARLVACRLRQPLLPRTRLPRADRQHSPISGRLRPVSPVPVVDLPHQEFPKADLHAGLGPAMRAAARKSHGARRLDPQAGVGATDRTPSKHLRLFTRLLCGFLDPGRELVAVSRC